MKRTADIPKFLVSCAKFTLLVAGILIALFLWNNYLINKYRYTPLPDTETLICGPSIMRRSFDPELLPNAENVAQDAEFYGMSKIKLDYILNQPHNIKNLVLFLSPAMFAKKLDQLMDNPLAHKEITRRLYPITTADELSQIGVPKVSAYQNMFQQYALINPTYMKVAFTSNKEAIPPHSYPYIGQFHRSKRSNIELTRNRFADMIIPQSDKESAFDLKHQMELFKILDIAKQQNLRVILVNTPLYRSLRVLYTDQVDQEFQAVKKEIFKRDEVYYLDLSRVNLPDSMYSSITHLNTYGADFCTDTLRNWMMDHSFFSATLNGRDL